MKRDFLTHTKKNNTIKWQSKHQRLTIRSIYNFLSQMMFQYLNLKLTQRTLNLNIFIRWKMGI